MSNAIHITYKKDIKRNDFERFKKNIKEIDRKITPSNITPKVVNIKQDKNTISAVFNPVESVRQTDSSLCLGYVENEDWDDVKSDSKKLEGTFAIFRKRQNKVQLITDWVGSRTIWYYCDKDKFIGSTSQLAIIYYLETFEFNQSVIPWILSSGTLGPFHSWDKRIKALKPKSVLTLDTEDWEIDECVSEISFKSDINQRNQEVQLKKALNQAFRNLKIDTKKWMLPLSGGYDSRGILMFLKQNNYKNIKTITWGAKKSENERNSDAYIAKKLAMHFDVSHKYALTEKSSEPVEEIVHRFLINGEGRIDNIAGYMDGFKIWKFLYENNYDGVIRGDEAFGTGKYMKKPFRYTFCSDYNNLTPILKQHKWNQDIPIYYEKRKNESKKEWRDRVYHTYSIPIGLAALNTLKLNYCEIINPLLSPSILKIVYKMSDKYRDDKTAFRKIINNEIPQIPIAKQAAILSQQDILRQKEFTSYIRNVLHKKNGPFNQVFITELCEKIKLNNLKSSKKTFKNKIKEKAVKFLPVNLIQFLVYRGRKNANLDNYILAFRVVIIIKMIDIIENNIKLKNS